MGDTGSSTAVDTLRRCVQRVGPLPLVVAGRITAPLARTRLVMAICIIGHTPFINIGLANEIKPPRHAQEPCRGELSAITAEPSWRARWPSTPPGLSCGILK